MTSDDLARMQEGIGIDPVAIGSFAGGEMALSHWREPRAGRRAKIDYTIDSFVISMPLRPLEADGWYDDEKVWSGPIRNGCWRVTPPGKHSWQPSSAFDVLFFVLSPDWMERILEAEAGAIANRIRAQLSTPAARSLYLWDFQLASMGSLLAGKLCACGKLEHEFISGMSHAFASRAMSIIETCVEKREDECCGALRLEHVCAFVDRHFAQNLSVADLAALTLLSPSRFAHVFKEVTGQAPHQYVTGVRLGKAKERLRSSDDSVLDIALDCGFADPSHFARIFRHAEGVSPSRFRRINDRKQQD